MQLRTWIAGAAVGLLAGCGSVTDHATPTLSPGQAVTKAQFASLVKHGRDFKTAHVSVTTGTGAARRTIEIDVALHPLAEKLHLVMAGKPVEARLVGREMYLHVPGAPGSGWAKFNIEAYRSIGLGGLVDVIDDPLAGAEKTAKAVSSVTYVGREQHHGVSADHYRAIVDVQAAVKVMFPDGLPNGASLPTSSTEDLWADTQGHMVESDVDMGKLGVTTIKLSAINAPLVVRAPAGEVTDITQEIKKQGSSLLDPGTDS